MAQLLNYLSDKRMLLLLDNFEQLIDQDGPAVLLEILAATPSVKLLVTSRETLNLQEEWRYPLHGLPVPNTPQMEEAEPDDAVQLFMATPRRATPAILSASEPIRLKPRPRR